VFPTLKRHDEATDFEELLRRAQELEKDIQAFWEDSMEAALL
jgi:hypothetical protein